MGSVLPLDSVRRTDDDSEWETCGLAVVLGAVELHKVLQRVLCPELFTLLRHERLYLSLLLLFSSRKMLDAVTGHRMHVTGTLCKHESVKGTKSLPCTLSVRLHALTETTAAAHGAARQVL